MCTVYMYTLNPTATVVMGFTSQTKRIALASITLSTPLKEGQMTLEHAKR